MHNKENEEKSKVPFYFLLKMVVAVSLFFLVLNFDIDNKPWLFQFIKGAWTFLLPSIIVSIARFIVISFYNARHTKKNFRGHFVLGI